MFLLRLHLLAVLLAFPVGAEPPKAEEPHFPAFVTDIDGRTLDVGALAHDRNLVVVTLKAPWCPVCQEQLVRIRERLPELEACGVTFLVLAPGTPQQLAEIRRRTGFDFPFIADEGLAIARSLGLAMTDREILPCMLEVRPDRGIGWRQLGRNGAYFGDAELAKYFDCARFA